MPNSNNFLKVLVNPEDVQIECAGTSVAGPIDVVAVHGLNYTDRENHAELTWTASNGKMWLRDLEFLPNKLPNARILLFGYNANVAFRASAAGVDQQADNLLNRLYLLRGKSKTVGLPIMFICYSLGGIIVKRALVIAKSNSTYASICRSSYGLVFFGTPHQGGNFASLGEIAKSIAGLSPRYPGNTFKEALAKDSLFADTVIKDFRHQLEDRFVVTFYETHPVENVGIIVDQKSATFGLPGPREIQIALDTDHENLCKFRDYDGHDFDQVGDNIQELAQKATEIVSKATSEPGDRSTPRISTLPDLLHQHFTGREPQLQQLHEIIAKPGSKARRASIYGMPGVGKTQLALKFADCSQLIYKNTFYVQATDEKQLLRDFGVIHSLLQLPKRPQDEQEIEVRDVLQWLINNQDNNSWLIIFDNILDVNITKKFLPPGGAGVIIFTMRSERIAIELGSAGRLELLPMEEPEGVELILKIAEFSDPLSSGYLESRKLALEIQRELGGLPLALAQGTTFSKYNRWSMKQYLDRLRGTEKIETLEKETLMGSDITLYTNSYSTFTVAVENITPTAVMLLKFISHFDQDVPLQLFKDGRLGLSNFLDSLSITNFHRRITARLQGNIRYRGSRSVVKGYACDESIKLVRRLFFANHELEEAVLCIQNSALIRRNVEGNIWMHDLFRELAQHLVGHSEKKFIAASAIALAEGALCGNKDMIMEEAITLHLAKSLKHAQEVEALIASYAASSLLFYSLRREWYLESPGWYQRALAGYEKVLGKKHPQTLQVIHNIAMLFAGQGDYGKALEWYQRALAGFEKTLGKEHPNTLNSVHNMANVFRNQGDYGKALEWYQRALAGREKVLGKEHPHTLSSVHNMAEVFSNQGDYGTALEWYQRALAGFEKTLGKEHPDTLNSVHDMANVFRNQGDYGKALEWYQRALAGREKVLGKEHPHTLNSIHDMAAVFSDQGDYGKALEWHQRVLAGREKVLGKEHPDTLNSVHNMATVFSGQGDYGKALEWHQRALAGHEKVLGKEHPDTLSSVHNMATVFSGQGDYGKALEWYQRALAGREKALGKEHYRTLGSAVCVEELYTKKGYPEEAAAISQKFNLHPPVS